MHTELHNNYSLEIGKASDGSHYDGENVVIY